MKENIKNTYISPIIEVFEATSEDVISTSGFDGNEDVLNNENNVVINGYNL